MSTFSKRICKLHSQDKFIKKATIYTYLYIEIEVKMELSSKSIYEMN